MNFSINTSVFASAASAVDRAVTSTSVQPSLRGIKIQAVNDRQISQERYDSWLRISEEIRTGSWSD